VAADRRKPWRRRAMRRMDSRDFHSSAPVCSRISHFSSIGLAWCLLTKAESISRASATPLKRPNVPITPPPAFLTPAFPPPTPFSRAEGTGGVRDTLSDRRGETSWDSLLPLRRTFTILLYVARAKKAAERRRGRRASPIHPHKLRSSCNFKRGQRGGRNNEGQAGAGRGRGEERGCDGI